jgi:hypothetical protein
MTYYEPYLPWSCCHCGCRGRVSVPASVDGAEAHYRVLEAHAIATDGACLAVPYTGEPERVDLNPLRSSPSLF